MDWIDTIQKASSLSGLPLPAKLLISGITVAINLLFLFLVWSPPAIHDPQQSPVVRESYSRMQRVLGRLAVNSGNQIIVDGAAIPRQLAEYYQPYLAIAEYVRDHPGDAQGAYEKVWDNGGASRTFINDTQAFESVVSRFFNAYENAKGKNDDRH